MDVRSRANAAQVPRTAIQIGAEGRIDGRLHAARLDPSFSNSGMCIAVKSKNPGVKVIGVQSKASPVMYESLKAGKIIDIQKARKSIAEGLSGNVGTITFEIVQKYVDCIMLVKEETIRNAVYLLWAHDRQIVEGSGAAAVATVIENRSLLKDKRVVSVVTGGNIDSELFQNILESER